jgi:hypothetical protein
MELAAVCSLVDAPHAGLLQALWESARRQSSRASVPDRYFMGSNVARSALASIEAEVKRR